MENNCKCEKELPAFVNYEDFGAAGDGKTNDIEAILAAHDFANAHGIPVKAEKGKIYRIGAAPRSAEIKTDVDWTDVSFILDDRGLSNAEGQTAVFHVVPTKSPYQLEVTKELKTIAKGQTKLPLSLEEASVLVLNEASSKRYIRYGENANAGSPQTELIAVDKDGNVDPGAPVVWNYTDTSSIRVYPMDETTLTVRGGIFTTIAHEKGRQCYYSRGVLVTRSNVVVDGLKHHVLGEGDTGALYSGILYFENCANVKAKNCLFTAHRYPPHPCGRGGVGSYDLSVTRVINVSFEHCRQTNDILNRTYWGVICSNFCKNISLSDCIFSRFDAHQGVANVTIRGCELGWQCLSVIGSGTFLMEDSKVYGSGLVGLRTDYGSTWEGELILRRCTWKPNLGNVLTNAYAVITGSFRDDHSFGYECYLPHTVTIEDLYVDDSNAAESYAGINIFGNFNAKHVSEEYEASLADNGYPPYHLPGKLNISGFRTASGRTWNLSANPFMFRRVEICDGENAAGNP